MSKPFQQTYLYMKEPNTKYLHIPFGDNLIYLPSSETYLVKDPMMVYVPMDYSYSPRGGRGYKRCKNSCKKRCKKHRESTRKYYK